MKEKVTENTSTSFIMLTVFLRPVQHVFSRQKNWSAFPGNIRFFSSSIFIGAVALLLADLSRAATRFEPLFSISNRMPGGRQAFERDQPHKGKHMNENTFEFSTFQSGLMSRKEAANYLGVSEQTLAIWKCTGRYNLACVKIGRLVKYRKVDLDEFISKGMSQAG